MDVFKLEQGIGGALSQPARPATPEVSFDAGSEFNLSFFDAPDDSAHSCFSDPGSVGSAPPSSPPPPPPPHQPCAAPSPSPLLHCGTPNATLKQEPQQYAAADSASAAASSKAFVPCKVCGDKASGYHYGVTSCEGCKGFFRRSIQKQIEYRCLRDGKCLVIRLNRNRCQFCRFKKCLAVGMSRDSVRYGRVPKRSREHSGDENGASAASSAGSARSSPAAAVCGVGVGVGGGADAAVEAELTRCVSAAHRAHCAFGDERTRGLDRRPVAPPSPPPPGAASPGAAGSDAADRRRVCLWQHLASRLTPCVPRVVEFAKRVPGFGDLSQDDQLILIKMGFFEVWLSHATRLATDSTLTFDDGAFLTHQQLESVYDVAFASSLLHFTSSLNSLGLNETELALFSAAVLVTSERPGVTDVKTVQYHQDKIFDALKYQISLNHNNSKEVGAALTTLLVELRNVGARHFVLLDWFRVNWTSLKIPPLFAEIFDIPKCDDDLQ